MYILYGGFGGDGGFGDYAPPYWSEDALTDKSGAYVWVETEDEATKLVERLNGLSQEKFYSTGVHDQYDGRFPYEYKYVKVPLIEHEAYDLDGAVEALTDKELWITNCYGVYDEDDEDYDEDD